MDHAKTAPHKHIYRLTTQHKYLFFHSWSCLISRRLTGEVWAVASRAYILGLRGEQCSLSLKSVILFMSSIYETELLHRPGRKLSVSAQKVLQASLLKLGSQCLNPLPDYQVFSTNLSEAFDDKILVLARYGDRVIAFVSAVIIRIPQLQCPVIHSGLTVIHPEHRRSAGVIQLLFGNLFLHVLCEYPGGVWITTLAEVISSLVHMSKYAINVFPSPHKEQHCPVAEPGSIHITIAREISKSYRAKMLISPEAKFDEQSFVFRGSNDHPGGRAFMKDVDDPTHWHRDQETSKFYRKLFRKDRGDEVLQVGFLDPKHVREVATGERFRSDWGDRYSKL
ncbi:hypothetical protein BJ170DRAFT_706823 [Xylariales sp. AK1849]|nr:hypothetical protein BJ170DRAFT_706823 [Xylariales sp. AK1849]